MAKDRANSACSTSSGGGHHNELRKIGSLDGGNYPRHPVEIVHQIHLIMRGKTVKTKRMPKLAAVVIALALVAAACGDSGGDDTSTGSDDSAATTAAATETTEAATETTEAMTETTEAGGEDAPLDGNLGTGVEVDLQQCVDWSDTEGVDGDEIRLGISLPQSGPLAVFGGLGEGMQAYFDFINENDPIDGKQIVLVQRDDSYDAAITKSNIEEMIETEGIFAFTYLVGSANNVAARSVTNENCVPQIFNSTGLPHWGDPVNFPWTVGGLLSYSTEASLWCQNIADEFGEGATVAGLFMANDFGKAYQVAIEECDAAGTIELVSNNVHEAAAPDIAAELADAASSGAQAFVFGSTGAFCPQAMVGVAQSPWEPLFLLSNTCSSIASFFTPVDPAGNGVRLVGTNIEVSDSAFADNQWVMDTRTLLEDAGFDPDSGTQATGVIFGTTVEYVLRQAAAMDGGLTRTNLMRAVWSMDFEHPAAVPGAVYKLDGANDAYAIEAGQIREYIFDPDTGTGSYVPVGDLIDLEGTTGTYQG